MLFDFINIVSMIVTFAYAHTHTSYSKYNQDYKRRDSI